MPDDQTLTRVRTATTGGAYELPVYPFVEPLELRGAKLRHAVVIAGAGLVGLTAACDCALRGIPAAVLDEDDTTGVKGASSRGICYAQKSLEIFRRLGIADRMLAKGIQWSVGRTFAGRDEIYSFDLKTARTHDRSLLPPFVNLQQFYVEWFLVDRIAELGGVELRWKNRLIGLTQRADHVELRVTTPQGDYTMEANWVLDCSGSQSPVRDWLRVGSQSSRFVDRWCISDVRFDEPPPAERWTWIEAPFNEDRAVWQHLMADGVWRLDYQMPADADSEAISQPDVVAERLRRQFGAGVDFEIVWVGAWAYRSFCLDRFRDGRVFFAGDAAHVMSPFGARGGNSGIQDADNLVWKLALVLDGRAPEGLLDSYNIERRAAALENLRVTDRTARFLSPPSLAERQLRDAVISLAREHAFARSLVNMGRLSVPVVYAESPLNAGHGGGRHVQNVALTLPDGKAGDLVDLITLSGHRPIVLAQESDAHLRALESNYPVRVYSNIADPTGHLGAQLDLRSGGASVVRPDLVLSGTFDEATPVIIERAVRTTLGLR